MDKVVQIARLILGHLPFLGESYQRESKHRQYARRFSKIENTINILTKAVEECEVTVLGQLPPRQAFHYAYEIVGVNSCMVGIGSEEELDTGLKAARDVQASR